MNERLTAALDYAKRGWHVLPVQARGKVPLTARGVKDATTREDTILEWWKRWPSANVGIATGEVSGLVVIDIDGTDGEKALAEFGNPPSPCVLTSKGRHIYFQHPGQTVRNAVAVRPSMDVRGDGGYVVAPPSTHESGAVYRWDTDNGLDDALTLAPLPLKLSKLVTGKNGRGPTLQQRTHGAELPAAVEQGTRNDMLFRFGCRLREHAFSADEIEAALAAQNAARCKPPLPEDELVAIAASCATYEPGKQDKKVERVGHIAATVEPWPTPVNGADLLDDLLTYFERFTILPDHGGVILSTWTVYAWVHVPTLVSPRLVIKSPVRGCGKTITMSALASVVPRPWTVLCASKSAMFRRIEETHPTLCLDEFDTWAKLDDDIRNVLNGGWQFGFKVSLSEPVGRSFAPVDFDVFTPTAIALIGNLPSTLEDRAIEIPLKKKLRVERTDRFRIARPPREAADLRRRCLRWADDHRDTILSSYDYPALPDELPDRACDNWAPLVFVADLAGSWWPKEVRLAAKKCAKVREEEDASVRLLADVRTVFGDADFMASSDLVAALRKLEDAPWGEWGKSGQGLTTHSLARLLKPFQIKPGLWREGESVGRGYTRKGFEDAWTRYGAGGS